MLFLLLALALLPQPDGIIRESADVAEVEAVYSDEGCLQLTQLILWSGDLDGVPTVRDWRILKDGYQFTADRVTFFDGDHLREVRFKLLRRSWSFTDSEVENRAVLPVEKRARLMGGRR